MGNALREVGGEVRSFLFTHGDDAVQCLVEFSLQVLFPGFVIGIGVCKLQYFGNGKYVF